MHYLDSHNHLQDPRISTLRPSILAQAGKLGIAGMVVNGTSEADWLQVQELSKENQMIVPSFGLHPWFIRQRSTTWKETLLSHLEKVPSAIGEIGLDRWIKDFDPAEQEEVFLWQWRLAAERGLPASVHCLKAWGRLLELIQANPGPKCGFLLHSYGGPAELIKDFTELGAYFSFSGHFAHERKAQAREIFKQIPNDHILVETDAPDMLPPDCLVNYPIADPATGRALNHPANLPSIYEFAAELRQESLAVFSERIKANFLALFGDLFHGNLV